MKTGWGILGTLAVAMTGVVPLSGCVTDACPAIGYVSTLTVNVDGNAAAVRELKPCDEHRCSVPEPTPGTAIPKRSIEPTFSPDTVTPAPATYPPFTFRKSDDDTWVFTLGLGAPSNVTVSAVGEDGSVLAEQDYELTWTRVGGSERCGGPVTTPPISLPVA